MTNTLENKHMRKEGTIVKKGQLFHSVVGSLSNQHWALLQRRNKESPLPTVDVMLIIETHSHLNYFSSHFLQLASIKISL